MWHLSNKGNHNNYVSNHNYVFLANINKSMSTYSSNSFKLLAMDDMTKPTRLLNINMINIYYNASVHLEMQSHEVLDV